MQPAFVLIHSPLVGPYTWRLVAEALGRHGRGAIVPELRSPPGITGPYWERHTDKIVRAVDDVSPSPLVLVAHSGAGSLLPAVSERLGARVAACIYVDSGLPHPARSRFDTFDDAVAVEQSRASARGGMLRPPWTSADLRPSIPDDSIRAAFIADIQPMALDVYEEPMPGLDLPADRPCGYLLFSARYRLYADAAAAKGWLTRELPGGHFEMLAQPEQVAGMMAGLASQMIG